jgi:hypothetical protein
VFRNYRNFFALFIFFLEGGKVTFLVVGLGVSRNFFALFITLCVCGKVTLFCGGVGDLVSV